MTGFAATGLGLPNVLIAGTGLAEVLISGIMAGAGVTWVTSISSSSPPMICTTSGIGLGVVCLGVTVLLTGGLRGVDCPVTPP